MQTEQMYTSLWQAVPQVPQPLPARTCKAKQGNAVIVRVASLRVQANQVRKT